MALITTNSHSLSLMKIYYEQSTAVQGLLLASYFNTLCQCSAESYAPIKIMLDPRYLVALFLLENI